LEPPSPGQGHHCKGEGSGEKENRERERERERERRKSVLANYIYMNWFQDDIKNVMIYTSSSRIHTVPSQL
jgi:hypothetical protein